MEKLLVLFLAVAFVLPVSASDASKEKPIEHLKIPDVTTMDEAKDIFIAKTAELESKEALTPSELQEIHFITYSLEKSVAYFAENLAGKKQALANEMAVVVEEIHLSSEKGQQEDAREHLKNYVELADEFMCRLKYD